MPKSLYVLLMVLCIVGCSPSELHRQYGANAISTVYNHMSEQDRQSYNLQAHSNPWGQGAVIFNANARRPDDVRVWVYLDPTAFALDEESRLVTGELPLMDAASETLQRKSGIVNVSRDEVRSRVFRAISQGTPLRETK